MKTIVYILIALSMAAVPIASHAEDWCKSDFVRSWVSDRDATATRMIRLWLNGAAENEIMSTILNMTRKEIHLGNCSASDLYISQIENTAQKQIPAAVLLINLKRNGINIDPKECFQGRSFAVTRGGLSND